MGRVKYHLELNSMKKWSGRQDMFEVRVCGRTMEAVM